MTMVRAYTSAIMQKESETHTHTHTHSHKRRLQTWVCAHADMEKPREVVGKLLG